jgi:hypothetical protein
MAVAVHGRGMSLFVFDLLEVSSPLPKHISNSCTRTVHPKSLLAVPQHCLAALWRSSSACSTLTLLRQ